MTEEIGLLRFQDFERKSLKFFVEIQNLVYEEYKLNGYAEEFEKAGAIGDVAEIGLITTETSEAIEDIREDTPTDHDKGKGLPYELADIIIRAMNAANRFGYSNLEPYILRKNEINLKRGRLHGKKA